VYRLTGGQLVLDLQADLIDTGSRVVAPLVVVAAGPRVIGRFEPVFEVHGEDHALHTAEMAAIPSALLKVQPIADLPGSDYEIQGAFDMVFSGF
jgi:toxin CcdB